MVVSSISSMPLFHSPFSRPCASFVRKKIAIHELLFFCALSCIEDVIYNPSNIFSALKKMDGSPQARVCFCHFWVLMCPWAFTLNDNDASFTPKFRWNPCQARLLSKCLNPHWNRYVIYLYLSYYTDFDIASFTIHLWVIELHKLTFFFNQSYINWRKRRVLNGRLDQFWIRFNRWINVTRWFIWNQWEI